MAIATAGGVEAIMQGMKAHVGMAGVQEQGAAALMDLAADGAWGASCVGIVHAYTCIMVWGVCSHK